MENKFIHFQGIDGNIAIRLSEIIIVKKNEKTEKEPMTVSIILSNQREIKVEDNYDTIIGLIGTTNATFYTNGET